MSSSRFFFVHVMKAGGTSFLHYARECLGPGRIWFGADNAFIHRYEESLPGENLLETTANNFLDAFFKTEPEVFRYVPLQGACFFEGHMPFAARHALECGGQLPQCLSILRHPVDRIASHLTQDAWHMDDVRGKPERLYGDPYWHSTYGRNYQAKLFSMTPAETFLYDSRPPGWLAWMEMVVLVVCATTPDQRRQALQQLIERGRGYANQGESMLLEADIYKLVGRTFPNMAELPIDNNRFDMACNALEICAVIGVTDQLTQMTEEMRWRFGWSGKIKLANQSLVNTPLSASLRKQIARDNEADIELYEYARKLVRKQQQSRMRRYSLPG